METPAFEPFEQTQRSAKRCRSCRVCSYCGGSLHVAHQHDHAPVAHRHGGSTVVAACRDCHTLKDRKRFSDWPVETLTGLIAGMTTPEARLLMAQMIAWVGDVEGAADQWEKRATHAEGELALLRSRP